MLIAGIALTVAAVAVLLWAEHRDHRVRGPAKLLAATGFLIVVFSEGVPTGGVVAVMAAGLVLSALGDAFLLSDQTRWFVAGLVSFLLAHIAYAAAFVASADRWGSPMLSAAVVVVGLIVGRWLLPHVESPLRIPVVAYMVVITAMVVTSLGTVASGSSVWVAVGAIGFWLSDLAVARQRFVTAAFANKAIGLPLYFAAQLVLAWVAVTGRI